MTNEQLKELVDKLDYLEENILNAIKDFQRELTEVIQQYKENNIDSMPSDRQ